MFNLNFHKLNIYYSCNDDGLPEKHDYTLNTETVFSAGCRVYCYLPCFAILVILTYLFNYLVRAVLALLTTFQPVVKDKPDIPVTMYSGNPVALAIFISLT